MEEAGRISNLAVSTSLNACKEGITEIEMDAVGTKALFEETAKNHPDSTLDLFVMSPSGIKRTVMPHVFQIQGNFNQVILLFIVGKFR